MKVCCIVAHFYPGYKAGGPGQSIINMIKHLGSAIEFEIITTDRDYLEKHPYPSIKYNEPNKVFNANVFYLQPWRFNLISLQKMINNCNCEIIYLNSFFSYQYTIQPLMLWIAGILKVKHVIIAPRGEFSKGAFRIKSFKKSIFIKIIQILGLCKKITFQASSTYEASDIYRILGKNTKVIIAPNIVTLNKKKQKLERLPKEPGTLSMCFLSRIVYKKNLHGALDILNTLSKSMLNVKCGTIKYDIYGIVEDLKYWRKCEKIIEQLSPNIKVQYKGAVKKPDVISVLSKYDLFFFPTFGENFGHVIFEALASGCPLLISDQTPWVDCIIKGIGWEIPLSKPECFLEVIKECQAHTEMEHQALRKNAYTYAVSIAESKDILKQNKDMFLKSFQRK